MALFEEKDEIKARSEVIENTASTLTEIVQVKSALNKRDAEIQTALAKMAEEVKATGSVSAETVKSLDDLGSKANELATRLLAIEQKMARPAGGTLQVKSLGEQVTEHDSVKSMMEGKSTAARIDLSNFETKAAGPINSQPTSAGVLVQPQRLSGIIAPPDMPFFIRDQIAPGTTGSNAIEYIREKLFINSAAPVAELAMKPQSDITFDMETTMVKTIAHWMLASKQIMDDAKQLASYINGRLIYGLKDVEETQLLFGDGTGQNLLGIVPQATAFDTTLLTRLKVTNKTHIDTLRAAMLQVQLALYPPSAFVLHPIDWTSILLTKDANGNYLMANPQSTIAQILWSLPVVASMRMAEGSFLTGAFRLGAQVFDREQANIAISYEDRDNFVKNAVTIRAEERLALVVYRPQAFVTGTLE